ncbi:unnamed protein product [Calypogeia fissa]
MPGSGMTTPCAACKLLRRRCAAGDCIFAPYFPPHEPQKFANVHKIYGASNVSKMLQSLPVHQRADAVNSLVYQADSRVRDPVYGCVGAISALQQQLAQLQTELAVANAEMVCMSMQQAATPMDAHGSGSYGHHSHHHHHQYQHSSPGVDSMELHSPWN